MKGPSLLTLVLKTECLDLDPSKEMEEIKTVIKGLLEWSQHFQYTSLKELAAPNKQLVDLSKTMQDYMAENIRLACSDGRFDKDKFVECFIREQNHSIRQRFMELTTVSEVEVRVKLARQAIILALERDHGKNPVSMGCVGLLDYIATGKPELILLRSLRNEVKKLRKEKAYETPQ